MNWVQVFPTREVFGDGSSRFVLGDSARTLAVQAGTSQLVYLDPPFMSGGTYRFTQRVGEAGWKGDIRYQLSREAYGDSWGGNPAAYLDMLRPVLEATKARLSDTGALALHLDWRASGHARLLLDELFGADHFVNELIWAYQTGGRSDKHFSRKHDTIFLYRKGEKMDFYPQAVGSPRGREKRNHLRRSVDEDGRVYFSIRSAGKEYRYYEDDLIVPGDVWTDIAPLQQKDPERTGYETQKPLALAERIILALTKPGQQVCDPFSGSGTTAAAAVRLKRTALAMDLEPTAAHLFRRRLLYENAGFTLENLPVCPPAPGRLNVLAENGRAELLAYEPETTRFAAPPTLLPHRDTAVDTWGVGHMAGDTFFAGKYSLRTSASPALEWTLPWEGENSALFILDIEGRGSYWMPQKEGL